MPPAISNLVELVQQRARDYPDCAAYIFLAGEDLRQSSGTYGEVDLRARSIAGLLQELGARGERALLLYPPGLEFIAAFFGCLYAGVIAVPAYPPRLNRNALRIVSMAKDSQASLALTSSDVLSRLGALTAHTPKLGQLRWYATDTLHSDVAKEWQDFSPQAGGLAYLQYTSGSTSTPKGVMITHANVLHNSGYLAEAFRHSAQDVSLSWLPHFHDLGLVHGILQPLFSSFPGYLMAPMSFLQRPVDWLRAISRFGITHSDGPNFAYELCLNKITAEEKRELDLSSWRMALTGAEPIFPETIERFTEAFASCGFKRSAFFPAYGLAEATLVVSGAKKGNDLSHCCVSSAALEESRIVFVHEDSPGARMLVASGAIGRGMDVAVVEPASGRRCSPDQIGEIWVAGPSVAMGYWRRLEETAQVFGAELAETTEHRFLRTGDLGFIRDGYLFITGRLKELIIIRGRNYYPQDIERTARESCPAIRLGTGAAFSVSAATGERMVMVQEVHRREKVDANQIFGSIREAIAEEHEVQIHEIVLVTPGSVPRTSSGKIQRNLCYKEFLEGTLEVTAQWRADQGVGDREERPSLDQESIRAWLVAQVASNIGVDRARIDIDRPLISLGLDSLSAVELAHEVERTLRLAWQAASLLDKTIAELAAQAAKSSAGERTKEASPHALPTPAEYPLSYGQQGLWFLHQLAPESTAYNVAQAIRIKSRVDVPALQQSFQALVDRHGSLRTTFTDVNGSPVQRVCEQLNVTFLHESAQGWSESHMQQRLTQEAAYRFDLERGPLLRIHLFACAADDHVLLLTAHHIILDLWSLAHLMHELGVLYEAAALGKRAALPPVSAAYFEFVCRQKELLLSARGEQLWEYWSKQLSGELPVLDLMTDHQRPPVQTYCGSSHPFRLDAGLTEELKNLAQAHGATLYMTLFAAFQALLHRYTGEEEILTGSPVAGRTSAEFASTVGYFVNPVVLRASISVGSTFEKLLAQVHRTVLDALEHQDYPLSLLTEKLQPARDSSRSPLFQVMFAMQKAPLLHEEGLSLFALGEYGAHMNLGGLELESMRLEQRIAQFDLSLVMAEAKDELMATFEYNTALFDSTTVSRMAEHFTTLLNGLAENPTSPISSLPLAAEPTGSRARRADAQVHFANDVLVHELFEQQAARTPDAPALILEDEQLTYKELNERVNQMTRRISDLLEKRGAPVGLFLERSTEAIVGLLAIFRAGAVYVPVDPEYPKERIAFLLDDAGVDIVVTEQRLIQLLPPVNAKVLCVEAEQESITQPKRAAHGSASLEDPAYVIYTSGSTGKPKGVLVSHGALSNHMQWLAHEFPLDHDDRVLHKYSLSFDASLAEILHPLTSGAALVVARSGGQFDIGYLTQLMRKHCVTAIDVVPTMLKALLEDGRMRSCASLRRITSGGESLPHDTMRRTFDQLSNIELINMYGPTEAAITVSFHRCEPGESGPRIAIGAPIANTELYVLDHGMQPVPTGIPGEICIGGKGLAYGYINQPELTAEKFVPDPFNRVAGARLYKTGDLGRYRDDGNIEYVRRIDKQVKVRGFRIELAEIEAQLRKHSAINDAIAVVKSRASGDKYIAAYVQCKVGEQIASAQLRTGLSEQLPQYMVPAAITVMRSFPLLQNGKVDSRRLPEPENVLQENEVALPRDATEKALARIWQEVLGCKEVGIHSNFFELGGDSILSIQIVSRARDAGLAITPGQVFQFQTIAGLSQVAGRASAKIISDQSMAEGPVPLSPIQRWFFEQELPEPHCYSQSMMLEVKQTLNAKLLEAAVHHLVIEHDALRLRFHRTPQGWQQVCVGPDVNGIFQHVILPQLSSREQAARIEAISREAQASLNLEAGPLMRAVYFDSGKGANRILIVIHHLAVDGVSWRVILDDLHGAYEQLEGGTEIQLGTKTISFKQWSELLQQRAQDDAVRQEVGYWSALLSKAVSCLPFDRPGQNSAEQSSIETVCLNPEETQLLLRKVPYAYRTQINDVLLTAFAQTLAEWTGESRVLLDLEGHGREEITDGSDLSRSVGWFTSLFPVLVEIDPAAPSKEALKSIKEQLRRIPENGIGYGLLRYLCSDENTSRELRELPQAQVSFNYLGQLDQMCSPDYLFALAEVPLAAIQSSRGKRSYLIEVDAYIKDGQLQVLWDYSGLLHHRETIQQLAGNFIGKLRALIHHCAEREYTPSDFSLVKLTQQQIDRIQEVHHQFEDIYPLSPMQHGMLFHSLFEPQKGTYLTQLICELEGDLDRIAFREAWRQVVNNYAALRAGFEWEIVSDEPVQVIRHDVELQWREENWSTLSNWQQESRLEAYLKEDRKREIDLRRAPLMHFMLIQTAAAKHKFVWSSHHLVMDGWSLPIVLNDVLDCYASLRRKQPVSLKPERSYGKYIQWLREQDFATAADFWKHFLKDFGASTSLTFLLRVHPVSGSGEDFREQEISLSEVSTFRLQAFSRQCRLTLNTIVQGAWALLLSRKTSKDDVMFGVVCSGRPAQIADVESMVGLFINTLPMRAQIEEKSDLIDWLRRLQETQTEMSQFEYTPLSQVQAWSGLARDTALFESILVFENYPAISWISASEPELRIANVQSRERSNYPLTLWVMPGRELHLKIGYDANRLHDAGIARLIREYRVLLEAIAANPEQTVAAVLQSCELPIEMARRLTGAQKETDGPQGAEGHNFAHSARQGEI
jgi:amino acid adenylation domain-containing protein/non-ribosomal peptide synthase protein (TIGR01720 family)